MTVYRVSNSTVRENIGYVQKIINGDLLIHGYFYRITRIRTKLESRDLIIAYAKTVDNIIISMSLNYKTNTIIFKHGVADYHPTALAYLSSCDSVVKQFVHDCRRLSNFPFTAKPETFGSKFKRVMGIK